VRHEVKRVIAVRRKTVGGEDGIAPL